MLAKEINPHVKSLFGIKVLNPKGFVRGLHQWFALLGELCFSNNLMTNFVLCCFSSPEK